MKPSYVFAKNKNKKTAVQISMAHSMNRNINIDEIFHTHTDNQFDNLLDKLAQIVSVSVMYISNEMNENRFTTHSV